MSIPCHLNPYEKSLPEYVIHQKSSNNNPAEVVERFTSNDPIEIEPESVDKLIEIIESENELESSSFSPSTPNIVNDKGHPIGTSNTTIKVLIIAANPVNTTRLRLAEEVREITEVLRNSREGLNFIVEELFAVRFRDLRQAMLNFEPNIIHFCGHGAADGLVFEDDFGQVKFIPPEALSKLFELFKDHILCTVFNACYSEIQAEAIKQHINYVVGMNTAITDRAAIHFSTAFYEAIANGRSIEFAFKIGCNSIEAEGIPENSTPVLLINSSSNLIPASLKFNQIPHVDNNNENNHNTDIKLPIILFLAANPQSTLSLRLGEEVREIKRELRSVRQPSLFIEQRWATRLRDFHKAMLELKPQIVHFSGHGGEEGIIFESEQGQPQLVSPDALARHFKPYANQVNCVLLNACLSESQAKAISEHINYVIGMNKEIGDRAAIAFSIGFYRALAYYSSIEDAFELGCREIEIQVLGTTEYLTPSLYRKTEKIVTTTLKIEDEIQPNDIQIKPLMSRDVVVQEHKNPDKTESKAMKTYKDLEVYKMAFDAAMKIQESSTKFPVEERCSLIDKIRHSSRSVCANLAEAWRKRQDENIFVPKLNDCGTEVSQTRVLIEFAVECNYLDADTAQKLYEVYDKILGSLENIINHPSSWLIN